jgi:hypothetical protein
MISMERRWGIAGSAFAATERPMTAPEVRPVCVTVFTMALRASLLALTLLFASLSGERSAHANDGSSPASPVAAPAGGEPAAPEAIVAGIYLNQLHGIDLKAGQFGADFWIWFRWSGQGQSPIETFDIVGGRVVSKANPLNKRLPDGKQYTALRVNAIINEQWHLADFPFDNHDVAIQIEDAEREVERAVFVPDAENEAIDPGVSVPGWRVKPAGHQLLEHVYKSNYGDTSVATGNEAHYSRYAFRFRLEREGKGRFVKFFFGLFVAVLAAWTGFFIRPKDSSPRVSVSVGALFAASAVTISMNNQLPDVGYLTLADRMVFLTLGMILVSLLCTVLSLSLNYLGRESAHRRLDKFGSVLFPIVYAVLLTTVVL